MSTPFETDALVSAVRARVGDIVALYLFGSLARGDSHGGSDVDLAVLPRKPLDALTRFDLQEELARLLGRDVDLIDLRVASAVLRAQVLTNDRLSFCADHPARELFECTALSDYAHLNEE